MGACMRGTVDVSYVYDSMCVSVYVFVGWEALLRCTLSFGQIERIAKWICMNGQLHDKLFRYYLDMSLTYVTIFIQVGYVKMFFYKIYIYIL